MRPRGPGRGEAERAGGREKKEGEEEGREEDGRSAHNRAFTSA